MKILNVLFIIIFVAFAALQYNDPDPYIWIPIYLYAAFLCFLSNKNKYYPALYTVGLTVYLSYAAYLFFDKTGVLNWVKEHDAENLVQTMKATKPWIEETREFGGLFIVIIVLIVNMISSKKNKG
ncbi:transmembrane 220 family protein [Segetibacter sp.]|jgi:hypothetical protein|uniref:transmembrane 220 family protein n=1 Tax=Segetibacter sp. TaxID=2231182 RepID=UPI002626F05D|nr:transmembrane 220 family protein [Segetibacter sp.]MCW3080446.1 hypothetical protein [Segetibacter sp.]